MNLSHQDAFLCITCNRYGAADGVQGGQPWIHVDHLTGTMWLFATDNCCDPDKQHGVNIATASDGGFNWTQVLVTQDNSCSAKNIAQSQQQFCHAPLITRRSLACLCRFLLEAPCSAIASCGPKMAAAVAEQWNGSCCRR
jgi:hypothetical protein